MAQQRGPGGPGQNRGGFQKPKNLRKTVSRLMSYLTRRKWPLLIVLLCLLGSVVTNIAGSSFINLVIINNAEEPQDCAVKTPSGDVVKAQLPAFEIKIVSLA